MEAKSGEGGQLRIFVQRYRLMQVAVAVTCCIHQNKPHRMFGSFAFMALHKLRVASVTVFGDVHKHLSTLDCGQDTKQWPDSHGYVRLIHQY